MTDQTPSSEQEIAAEGGNGRRSRAVEGGRGRAGMLPSAVPAFRRYAVGGVAGQGTYRPTALPHYRLALCIAALTVGSFGCAKPLDPSLYPSPEALFEASLTAFKEGDCDDSDIGFRRLAFELPARHDKRAEVRYYLAQCMFKRHEYLEASREYRRVADENARDSLAPQALLRSGEAYAKLWRRPELDATYGLSALTAFQELLRRFPGTPAAAEARQRIETLNEWFAKKAYKAGLYYYRLKAFDSAIIYFKSVVADYPATSFAAESLVKLVEAYDRIGYEEDREDMCQQIRRFYPEILEEAEACATDTTANPNSR